MVELDLTGLGKPTMVNISAFSRTAEVDLQIGAPSEAKSMVGCSPNTTPEQPRETMVLIDLRRNQVGVAL